MANNNDFSRSGHLAVPHGLEADAVRGYVPRAAPLKTLRRRLSVVHHLRGEGVWYADDARGFRYMIDSGTRLTGHLRTGVVLMATVNDEGYVLDARVSQQPADRRSS